MTQRRVENTRVHFWTFSPVSVNKAINFQTEQEVDQGKIAADWWANVPLSDVRKAFMLSDSDFEEKYGAKKPSKDDEVILQCRSGGRSAIAQRILQDQGFTNTKNLEGGYIGFTNWEKAQKSHNLWQKIPHRQRREILGR